MNIDLDDPIAKFIADSKDKVLVAGYGSLLSRYSRETYNRIHTLGVSAWISNWQRDWVTRSISEQQTYAGAYPQQKSRLNALVIALDLDIEFQKREQDYRFTEVSHADLDINKETEILAFEFGQQLSADQIQRLQDFIFSQAVYICESLNIQTSDHDFPVHYSYIDTCLRGSTEVFGEQGLKHFFKHTAGWKNGVFVDDQGLEKYPRFTPINTKTWNTHQLINQHKSR